LTSGYRKVIQELEAGEIAMTVDRLINILAAITLIEMMVTIGLGVTLSDVLRVGRSWSLVARAVLANYILVPAAAGGLLLLFRANPLVAVGFLVAAACPGAPYGPPLTAMAKGNVPVSVGLMVILAGTSAILAPLLLELLLPLVAEDTQLKVSVVKMVGSLLGVQLLPLCLGVLLRRQHPALAERLRGPAGVLSAALNFLTLAVILFVQFRLLAEVRLIGYVGMLSLLIVTMVAGALASRRTREERKSMVITTSVRNVGVSLVIVTGSFPGTAAITSATVYALFQTIVMVLVALAWGRLMPGWNRLRENEGGMNKKPPASSERWCHSETGPQRPANKAPIGHPPLASTSKCRAIHGWAGRNMMPDLFRGKVIKAVRMFYDPGHGLRLDNPGLSW
jgi:BASS family bile acid:Na+ symporter